MLLLIPHYILLVASEVSYDSESLMLTIKNEPTITTSMTNIYQNIVSCYISSNENVEIEENAFNRFEKLRRINFSCPKVSIQKSSFSGCTNLKNITFNNTQINAISESFPMDLEYILYDGDNFNSKMFSFLTKNIKTIDIKVHNTCTFNSDENVFNYLTQTVKVNAQDVNFEENSLIYAKIKSFTINAYNSINIGSNSLQENQINEIKFEAGNNICMNNGAFQDTNSNSNVNYNKISISSNGTIKTGTNVFSGSIVETLDFQSKGNMFLGDNSLSAIHGVDVTCSSDKGMNLGSNSLAFVMIKYVNLKANDYITLGQESINSKQINNNLLLDYDGNTDFRITCNGPITFKKNSFNGNCIFDTFSVMSKQSIIFETGSITSTTIDSFIVSAYKNIYFAPNSINGYINQFWINNDYNVTIDNQAFKGTIIKLMIDFLEDYYSDYKRNEAIIESVTIGKQSFYSCNTLFEIQIKSHGTIFIDESAFENNQQLDRVYLMADKKIIVGNNAFKFCNEEADISAYAPEVDASNCARGGSCKKRKTSGCSPQEYDKYQHSGPISLGNVNINAAYLGLSPTIYVNLNFFIKIMRKARQLFGHIIPPPEFVHSAIWVGESDTNDDCIGAIFVYGKYYNSLRDDSFLSKDGARSFKMSLKEFKRRYSIDTMKIIPQKRIKLFDFIDQLKEQGKLTANDYNWPTNNCQHFTARCINILQAVRKVSNKDDWINIPKPILKTLELNEENEN